MGTQTAIAEAIRKARGDYVLGGQGQPETAPGGDQRLSHGPHPAKGDPGKGRAPSDDGESARADRDPGILPDGRREVDDPKELMGRVKEHRHGA